MVVAAVAVLGLFEDGIFLRGLELGLEGDFGVDRGVGATTGFEEVEVSVFDLVAGAAPCLVLAWLRLAWKGRR